LKPSIGIIVIAVIGIAAVLTILSMAGAFRPSINSTKYIQLDYKNGTATETLSSGESAGSVTVIAIIPYNSVIVSWAIPNAIDVDYRTVPVVKGQTLDNCAGKVTLMEISASTATFEFKRGVGGCPICVVQGIMMKMAEFNPEGFQSFNATSSN
jgi:hypothetical protein